MKILMNSGNSFQYNICLADFIRIFVTDKINPLEINSCFSFILEKVKETRMRKQEEFLQLRVQLRDLHKKEKAWTKSFRYWFKGETPC